MRKPSVLSTTIPFDLARRDRVSLRVYDVTGRLIRTLASRPSVEAGGHDAAWDQRDDAGSAQRSGLYFYRLEAGPVRETRRIVFVR